MAQLSMLIILLSSIISPHQSNNKDGDRLAMEHHQWALLIDINAKLLCANLECILTVYRQHYTCSHD